MDGYLMVNHSLGRVVDSLCERYRNVVLCLPVGLGSAGKSSDYSLKAENLVVVRQPPYDSSISALKIPFDIIRSYLVTVHSSDALILRGMLPYSIMIYLFAYVLGCKICHWIIGDPEELLKTHKRLGYIKNRFSAFYSRSYRWVAKLGRWLVDGVFICNGRALAAKYESPRTLAVVSSTITDREFYERADTCEGSVIRILMMSFIRPEKGVEYLIEAVAKLKTNRQWELLIVGSHDKYYEYKAALQSASVNYGIDDRVKWVEHATFGDEVLRYYRESDVFVLPTLSEGTPRVLVEARANSLPIVATDVGGIPTSVTNEYDGLLVPSKDSDALAKAIDRVIDDRELRLKLISNGFDTAKRYTIDKFVEIVGDNLRS